MAELQHATPQLAEGEGVGEEAGDQKHAKALHRNLPCER